MSSRKRGTESSLELLLDTICNTFGGVLFVAILIIIMLRMTSKNQLVEAAAPISESTQLELEKKHAELEGAIETLKLAGASLEVPDKLDETELAELMQELKVKQQDRHELIERQLKTFSTIATHQAQINLTNKELAALDERDRSLAKKLKDAEVALKAETESKSRKVEYAKSHRSSKAEIQTDMRFGRFYIWHRYGPTGQRLGLNTDDYVVLDDTGTAIRTTQNPAAGTVVVDDTKSKNQIISRLSAFNPSRHYICVVVWPDSFDTFQILKKLLVERGFEYRLIPAKNGDSFVDRGGGGSDIQ